MTGKLTWKKSAHSGSAGNCVEVAVLPGGGRAVRDSKNPGGVMLRFDAAQWRRFTARTKDNPRG